MTVSCINHSQDGIMDLVAYLSNGWTELAMVGTWFGYRKMGAEDNVLD
jgi:hypothetical protein